MDYELTDTHKLIRDTARRIAAGEGRPARRRARRDRRLPGGHLPGVRAGGAARPDDPGGVRRLRRGLPGAGAGRRRDRQARQRLLADPPALGALHPADQPRRLRGAEAGVALEIGNRRDQGRLLPDRAEHWLRCAGAGVARGPRRRRLRDQRGEDVHLRRQRRQLRLLLRPDRAGRRRHLRLHRAQRLARLLRPALRPQDGRDRHPHGQHRAAGLPRAGRTSASARKAAASRRRCSR